MPPRRYGPGTGQLSLDSPALELHPALVHVLTAEFQGIDPADFSDIPDEFVPYTHPDSLRASLLDVPPLDPENNHAIVGYRGGESPEWRRITVTSAEFNLLARHIPMLAETAIQGVFYARDRKLQRATGDPTARARSEDDWAAARRSAMRQVLDKHTAMQRHLTGELLPRVKLIGQFSEMTRYPNLARGTNQTVRGRVEFLRDYVFGDMLEAIGNLREWDNDKSKLASRTLQKRLYLDPDERRRVANFGALLTLAGDYYGQKQALVRGRIAEAERYIRNRPEVVADIRATDAARAAEKEHDV